LPPGWHPASASGLASGICLRAGIRHLPPGWHPASASGLASGISEARDRQIPII
jgi:hypothetical protein